MLMYNNIMVHDIESNSIYEMINDSVDLQDTIWLRTGAGISFIYFSNSSMPSFKSIHHDYLPEGGAPSFIINNNMMAISGATSIYQNGRYRPMGTGISWSTDKGQSWDYIDQPIDDVDESYILSGWGDQDTSGVYLDSLRFKAITTQIYNVTYDLEESNGYIYATSFAGGLRRFNYTIDQPYWELVPLPMDNQSELLCNQIDITCLLYTSDAADEG